MKAPGNLSFPVLELRWSSLGGGGVMKMGPGDAATLQGALLSSPVSSYFDLASVPPSQGWESRTAHLLVVSVSKGVPYCLKVPHLARSKRPSDLKLLGLEALEVF